MIKLFDPLTKTDITTPLNTSINHSTFAKAQNSKIKINLRRHQHDHVIHLQWQKSREATLTITVFHDHTRTSILKFQIIIIDLVPSKFRWFFFSSCLRKASNYHHKWTQAFKLRAFK